MNALRWAADDATRSGERLVVIHAWAYLPPAAATSLGWTAQDRPRQLAAARRALTFCLSAVFGSAVAGEGSWLVDGLSVRAELREGAPGPVLCAAATGASQLVVGVRGRSPTAGLLLGSVSQHVAAHASCPVTVVRELEYGRRWPRSLGRARIGQVATPSCGPPHGKIRRRGPCRARAWPAAAGERRHHGDCRGRRRAEWSNGRRARRRSTTLSPGASGTPADGWSCMPTRRAGWPWPTRTRRQLHISCGAVLHAATLLLRVEVGPVQLRLLPDPDRPDLLAWVDTGPDHPSRHSSPPIQLGPAAAGDAALLAALPRRHTQRGRFEPRRLPQPLLASLAHAAAAEGCRLRFVTRPGERLGVAHLVALADRLQEQDPAFQSELWAWSRFDDAARDGIPRTAVRGRRLAGPATFLQRDFDVDGTAALAPGSHADLMPAGRRTGRPRHRRPLQPG